MICIFMTKCHYYDFHFRWHALFTTEKSTYYQVVQDYGVAIDRIDEIATNFLQPSTIQFSTPVDFNTCLQNDEISKFPCTHSSDALLCVSWHKFNASKFQQPLGEKCMPSTPASSCLFRCWFVEQDRGHCVYHEDDASSLASGQYRRHPRGHSRKEKSTR